MNGWQKALWRTVTPVLSLGMCASALAAPAAPHEIETLNDVVVLDEKRGKELHLKIRFPRSGGPFPVILFSHSIDFSKNFAPDLSAHWASHGYVIIHPTHHDKDFASKEATTGPAKIRDPKLWFSRVQDMVFLIDLLAKPEAIEPRLAGKPDAARVGIGGHSIGSHTAALLGGTKLKHEGELRNLGDARVGAVLMVFPLEPHLGSLTDESWLSLELPTMSLAGRKPRERWGYEQSPKGDKNYVAVDGASYFSFVDAKSPVNAPKQLAVGKHATLLFWDASLKRDPEAREALRSGSTVVEGGVPYDIEWK